MVGRLMGPVGSGIGEGGRGRVMPVRVVLDAGVGRTREIRLQIEQHEKCEGLGIEGDMVISTVVGVGGGRW